MQEEPQRHQGMQRERVVRVGSPRGGGTVGGTVAEEVAGIFRSDFANYQLDFIKDYCLLGGDKLCHS